MPGKPDVIRQRELLWRTAGVRWFLLSSHQFSLRSDFIGILLYTMYLQIEITSYDRLDELVGGKESGAFFRFATEERVRKGEIRFEKVSCVQKDIRFQLF